VLAKKVSATIEKYSMITSGARVLAAVSGGIDSVGLLHVLGELSEPLGFRLKVAHLNHGVRGAESDADEAFVTELAERLGLEVFLEKVDAPAIARREKLSLEEACREARRRFLLDSAKRSGCAYIATGHHADDQAETVLIRLIRGAGITGLAAIRPVTAEGFIRPLLECRRREIRRYVHEKEIPYREDSSNLDRRYLRNRVRHDLIPLLERQFNPSIVDALCRLSGNMRGADAFLSQLGSTALQETLLESERDRMSLDLARLRAYDELVWKYVFNWAYKTLTGDSSGLTHRHLEALVDLVGRQPTGTAIHLPSGIRAKKGYDAIQLYLEGHHPPPTGVEKIVAVPGLTRVLDFGGTLETRLVDANDLPQDLGGTDPSIEFFDAKEISPPLVVRAKQDGDRIQPFGLHGTRKLKDVLIDLKIPRDLRRRLPVLTDAKGILWVVGVKRSDRARISPPTREVLSVRWLKES
jgi:tRNA(Ile)-lysidine synthase